MNIDIRIALAALRKAWGECTAVQPNLSLRTELLNYSISSAKMVLAGQIKSTAANNQHTAFETGANADITAAEVVALWTYLVERFDQSTIDLQTGNTQAGVVVANPTDLQVEGQMETYLRPITGYTNNFMYLVKCFVALASLSFLIGCGAMNSLIVHPLKVLHQEHENVEAEREFDRTNGVSK